MITLGITQARYNSSRLPGKVTKEIESKSLLQIHLERLKQSRNLDDICVATTFEPQADQILSIAKKNGVKAFQGSTEDVLDRFYHCANLSPADTIVRLTSDCPLIDPRLIDDMLEKFNSSNVDYLSNTLKPTYPDGIDVEIFKKSALVAAWNNAKLLSEREHVTPFIWKNAGPGKLFTSHSFENRIDYSQHRLTLDTLEDLKLLDLIIRTLGCEKSWLDYTLYLIAHPELAQINNNIARNSNYKE